MRNLPVKWGISLPNRGALFGLTDVDELIETAGLAEQSGVFESVWFGDSLIHKPRLEAITMLAAVATHTKKVRLGTICMASFPVRHPVLLAIQWASLDQISKGRALLGVCIGGAHEGELRAFGVKREERVGRMKEGIELLRQIWSDRKSFHRGKYYTLEGYNIVPKPVQKPPPIWIAVSPEREQAGDKIVDQAMRRVGALADGYITMGVTAEELGKRLRVIEQTANEIGKDLSNFEVAIHGMVNINDDKARGLRAGQRLLQSLLRSDLSAGEFDQGLAGSWTAQRLREPDSRMDRHGHHHAGAAFHRARISSSR